MLLLAAPILAAVLAATSPQPLATHPLFRVLNVEQGLPSSTVYKVAQDRDGFVWMGTADGLARYDGVDFRVFRHDPADPSSIPGTNINSLFIDRENRLWCGPEDGGLNMLGTERKGFANFRHDPADPDSLAGNDVWAIAQDAQGMIWAGTYLTGLDRLRADGRGFDHWRHADDDPHSLSSDVVFALYADARGRVWISTPVGLDLYENGIINHIDISAFAKSGPMAFVAGKADGGEYVMFGAQGRILRVGEDRRVQAVSVQNTSAGAVNGLAFDAAGDIWSANGRGVRRLHSDGNVDLYLPDPAVRGALPGTKVFDAQRDHEGGLWFGLLDGGVAYLAPQWRNFAAFRNAPSNRYTLSDDHVGALTLDEQGQVWVVNDGGGVDRLDLANGRVERFETALSTHEFHFWSVLRVGANQLWLGHKSGLRVYELESGNFRDVPIDSTRTDALAAGVVHLLVAAPDGAIWASVRGGGMHRIDAQTLAVTRYGEADGLRNMDSDQLRIAPSGQIWVAGLRGLDRFDPRIQKFVPVVGAPELRVHAFAFAADNTLWLHTLGALIHYRLDGNELFPLLHLDSKHGWPTFNAGGLTIGSDNAIWVSGPRGLSRFDPRSRAIRKFDASDGLADAQFIKRDLLQTAGGLIVGGTLGGVIAFDPRRIVDNPLPPPLRVTGISVRRDGRPLSIGLGIQDLALRWDDRDLVVSARALSYANPNGNRYQFRLQGFDNDWIDTGARGERDFSNLPPGAYTLELRAANASGVWSQSSTAMHLRVASPPWATAWAYALYIFASLLLLAAGLLAYRRRIKRSYRLALAEQRRQWAESASEAKSTFLATMGHEIRTPMTGVLGMTELLLRTDLDARQHAYAQTISQSGQLMLRLLNDALDLARIEAGKLELESKPVDLRRLLDEVVALQTPLAERKGLRFAGTTAADVPPAVLGDALRIKQLMLNLANNAIKFTERGSVTVALERDMSSRSLVLRVADSGPGIAEDTRARLFERFEQADGSIAQNHGGSGLGLAICRELVARMGGTITVESTLGVGSEFAVLLPLPAAEKVSEDKIEHIENAPSAMEASADLCILLVEDDATVAAVIAGLLERPGRRIRHAPHGLAALSELELGGVDLALLDLDLPGVDGLTLARMIREGEAKAGTKPLPLIAITARSTGKEEAQCLAAGMDAFLRKPITGVALAGVIDKVMRERRSAALAKADAIS
jgi:signal transduction histidine kinase/streptogramin lyase/AmiR/NasT family two-component response regulator